MFWKKKKPYINKQSKIILGMVLLKDENSFDADHFVKEYNNRYPGKIQELSGNNSSIAFKADNEMLAIGHMPVPIPSADIEGTAAYAYNWQTVAEDTKEHRSHLIVSVIQGGQDQIKRFKIFTQVICSLLHSTNSIGVYKGNQSLLITKEDYVTEAALMSNKYLPLNLWIYFGLRVTGNGNSGYTYGLKEFNKIEMEVLDSSKSLEDIRGLLFNIAHYVLDYNITFQDGQTCGLSPEEKIAITFNKGKFTDGDTLKLVY